MSLKKKEIINKNKNKNKNKTSQLPTSAHWLGKKSKFFEKLPNFQPRNTQKKMAKKIEEALANGTNLLCEAPTGIGKTYAYLVPILLSKNKAIISTGTKNLQDQLYHRDLPKIRPFLGQGKRFALLKGRANYLCLYRFENNFSHEMMADKQVFAQLPIVQQWAQTTRSGDTAECASLPEDASIWPYVTSTGDNCLGQECPLIGKCHLLKARKQAMEADIVVVNHHLLFSVQLLKDEGFAELLPKVQTIVFDEAHQVPEVASLFFSESFSSRQLITLVQDTAIEQAKDAKDMGQLLGLGEELKRSVLNSRHMLNDNPTRGVWSELLSHEKFQCSLIDCGAVFEGFKASLELASVRSVGLANCYQRAVLLYNKYRLLINHTEKINMIHWYECFSRSFSIHLTPLSIAKVFKEYIELQENNWIFTSATLTTNQHFAYFKENLGLSDLTSELVLDSPFSYDTQALLYVPRWMPEPYAENYVAACVSAAIPVIQASLGRTFFLFTSHKALLEAAELLAQHISYPLFIQGQMSKNELLTQFRASGNGVLLGTASFWEGIDIRGEALSCVIIDKLPFGSPGDPVTKARIDAYRAQGLDPFQSFQLPKAVIMLKQGAGRLIRDISDKGILMVCDHRLVSKPYGADFLNSLPPFQRTRDLNKVIHFVNSWKKNNECDVISH